MGQPPKREPDFARLYAESAAAGRVTPRLAYCLWSIAGYLADTWRDALSDPASLLEELPPAAQRVADEAWLARFVQCFEALAERMASADFPETGPALCTGDEMALHLVIAYAEDIVAHGLLDPAGSPEASLPAWGEPDPDFDVARDELFHDHDVLALFEPALDGIEDPESDVNRAFRMVNLHPAQWFLPFQGEEPGDE